MPRLLSLLVAAAASAATAAGSPRAGNATVELFLLPHTHADVGWLETPENLARVNVSRILDGVTGNLANDTKKRRRFVWDEMYFLEWWCVRLAACSGGVTALTPDYWTIGLRAPAAAASLL